MKSNSKYWAFYTQNIGQKHNHLVKTLVKQVLTSKADNATVHCPWIETSAVHVPVIQSDYKNIKIQHSACVGTV